VAKPIAFSVIESPAHPNLTGVLAELGYQEQRFSSVRKAIAGLKKHRPDVVIADFLFAYANNYASNHISNLDSLLISLQKGRDRKPLFVFVAAKPELPHVEQLAAQYPGFCETYHALPLPVEDRQVAELLRGRAA
jgi:hypothetical protein